LFSLHRGNAGPNTPACGERRPGGSPSMSITVTVSQSEGGLLICRGVHSTHETSKVEQRWRGGMRGTTVEPHDIRGPSPGLRGRAYTVPRVAAEWSTRPQQCLVPMPGTNDSSIIVPCESSSERSFVVSSYQPTPQPRRAPAHLGSRSSRPSSASLVCHLGNATASR